MALASLLGAEVGAGITWVPFSERALAQARAEHRPVLLNFEADWCLPCREMQRTTFRDPEIVRAAAAFTPLVADLTEEEEPAASIRDRYRVIGVPTYVLLDRDGNERRRLVGFIPAAKMLEAMDAVTAADGEAPKRG